MSDPSYPPSDYPTSGHPSYPGYGQGGSPDRSQQSYPGHGQPGYGQPGYGQPGYQHGSQPGYEQPGYGQPSGGQPGYGQPSYQQHGDEPTYSGYNQPGYSQPGYGQPSYQQPGYEQPGYEQHGYGQQAGQSYPGYSDAPTGSYPGYSQGTPPPPQKKSKGGKIALIVVAAIVLLCGGGGAIAYFVLKDPVKGAVEAAQTRLVAPDTLAGRKKITDPQFQQLADQAVADVKKTVPSVTSTVAAFYGDPATDMVMIVGASGGVTNPAKEVDKAIAEASAGGGLKITNVKSVEAGPLGGVAKCGDATSDGVQMGVCIWADNGSVAMVVLYHKNGQQAAAELVKIRGEVEKRG